MEKPNGLVYTNIQHDFRKFHKLSCNEYVLADMVHKLSTKVNSRIAGWCYMSKIKMAEELGVTKQTILNLLKSLELKGMIIKDLDTSFVKSSELWDSVNFERFTDGKETIPPVKKVVKYGKKTLPKESKNFTGSGKESLPYNNIDNNNYNNNIINDSKNESFLKKVEKDTLYQNMIDAYSVWYKDRNSGIPPKIDGIQGNAMKSLIQYFKTIVKSKNSGKISDNANDEVLIMFKYILNNWNKLNSYLQQKVKISELNSEITNIINFLKNGTGKEDKTNRESTIKRGFDHINEALRK